MSREVGITYSAPMASAIWRGEKWQTRRLVNIPDGYSVIEPGCGNAWAEEHRRMGYLPIAHHDPERPNKAIKPRLRVGDVMVVREPWRTAKEWDRFGPKQLLDAAKDRIGPTPIKWSDGTTREVLTRCENWGRYRHAMHMPFAFARSRRIVTGVRVERLGDISEADARAEGVKFEDATPSLRSHPMPDFRNAYAALWDRIHKPGAWDRERRKWVWVYEFSRENGI